MKRILLLGLVFFSVSGLTAQYPEISTATPLQPLHVKGITELVHYQEIQ